MYNKSLRVYVYNLKDILTNYYVNVYFDLAGLLYNAFFMQYEIKQFIYGLL